jgi:hypothetical protein
MNGGIDGNKNGENGEIMFPAIGIVDADAAPGVDESEVLDETADCCC